MADLEFGAALVCDDVRKEINNKDILIGVYTGDMVLPHVPIVVPLCFWIEVKPRKIGNYDFSLAVESPGGKGELDATMEVEDLGPAMIVTPKVPVRVEKEGELRVSVKLANARPKVLIRKTISVKAPRSAQPA